MQKDNQKRNLIFGLSLGIVAGCIFGGTYPMTRLGMQELSPWFLTVSRCFAASFLAGAFLLVLRPGWPDKKAWMKLSVVSACLVIAFPVFIALGLQTVSAGHAAVVVGILPLATAMLAVLINHERPHPLFWVFALLGSGLVIAFAFRDGFAGLSAGDAWFLGAVLAAALGYNVSGRLGRRMPGHVVISWAIVMAAPLHGTLTVLWMPETITAFKPQTYAAFAYLATLSQWLGFFALNHGFRLGGVAKVSQTQLLQVFVAIMLGHLILGEPLEAITFIFAGGVAACVYLGAQWKNKHV